MCLTKVGADPDARVAVVFSLPKVVHFLEAADAAFCATCSFWARSFAAGLVFLTQDLDLGGIRDSIEESAHEPKWRNRETYQLTQQTTRGRSKWVQEQDW